MSHSESESERRQQILSAAKRLFIHYGIGKTTVAEIARAASVSVGSVYLEFSSKNVIVAELAGETHASVLAAMDRAAKSRASYAHRLQAVLERRLTGFLAIAKDGPHGLDLVRCACKAAQRARANYHAAEHALLTKLLADGCAAGEFSVASPEQAARVLLRLYDGYTRAALERGDVGDLRCEIAQAQALVLNGLLARVS